ncbi:MAG: hypothetical protein HY721_12950 [Planctomycetes bacterium]|nr:hypothetical protein [Planctomycetota bacterium]
MRPSLPASLLLPAFAAAAAPGLRGEELDLKRLFQEGIPASSFMNVAYAYADAMLRHGRAGSGPETTGPFLGALDRKTLAPLAAPPSERPSEPPASQPASPAGGPLAGAGPGLDQNLLRLLIFLKGTSGEDRFPKAAEDALRSFLEGAAPRSEGGAGLAEQGHEPSGPWLLWEKCFELAPEAALRHALALRPGASPRAAGFALRAWAEAHARTGDATFLEAIEGVLRPYDGAGAAAIAARGFAPAEALSLAVDSDGAARKVPEPLRGRLKRLAARLDEAFLSGPHDLAGRKGFARAFAGEISWTPLWDPRSSGETTARVAVTCASRYENGGGTRFRDLVVAAAEAYLDALPEDGAGAWPMTFGHAIEVELAAFRATAREDFFRRALRLGEIAIERLFDGSPLPRASLRSERYESATGAGTLALALVDLHLTTRGITAVRAPANTGDR